MPGLDVLDADRAGAEDRRRIGGEPRRPVEGDDLVQPLGDLGEQLLAAGRPGLTVSAPTGG